MSGLSKWVGECLIDGLDGCVCIYLFALLGPGIDPNVQFVLRQEFFQAVRCQ